MSDTTSPDDDDCLDVEHHERVTRVGACESERARKRTAAAEFARLFEEEAILRGDLRDLGDDEHVDAIMSSGWFPYTPQIRKNARLAWIFDAILWAALWLGLWVIAMKEFGHD
jgi:hypothetical protein